MTPANIGFYVAAGYREVSGCLKAARNRRILKPIGVRVSRRSLQNPIVSKKQRYGISFVAGIYHCQRTFAFNWLGIRLYLAVACDDERCPVRQGNSDAASLGVSHMAEAVLQHQRFRIVRNSVFCSVLAVPSPVCASVIIGGVGDLNAELPFFSELAVPEIHHKIIFARGEFKDI